MEDQRYPFDGVFNIAAVAYVAAVDFHFVAPIRGDEIGGEDEGANPLVLLEQAQGQM